MYRKSSRLNIARVLCALILATLFLSGCVASTPVATPTMLSPTFPSKSSPTTSPPTPTPVPIATWVAQGVPEDTVINCEVQQTFRGDDASVTITADGTVNSVITTHDIYPPATAQGTGRISQDEVKRILLKAAEVDFFSLHTVAIGGFCRGDCVYHPQYLSDPTLKPTIYPDGACTTTSIAIHGMSRSIYHYGNCGKSALDELEGMILAIAYRIAGEPILVTLEGKPSLATSTAVTPTPTAPSSTPTRSP